jgi:hypothetical protein
MTSPPAPVTLVAVGIAVAFALASCSNSPTPGGRGGTGGAPMTASGALAIPDPPPMDAQAVFFSGRVSVETMLAKSDAAWRTPAPGSTERGPGGFGGSSGRGRGGGRRGGESGHPDSGAVQPARGPVMRASNAPPVQVRLRLTNQGSEPLEVAVLDFNSDLGNFVVLPATLLLPPGEAVEAEPMTSRLGVPAVAEIPLTIRLRLGDRTGPTESQVLKLQPRVETAATGT